MPLLRLAVRRGLLAPAAVLLQLHPVRVRAPVLRRGVVAALTRRTAARNDLAGHGLLDDLGDDARAHRAAALPDREPQLLLHRDRRDQLDRHRHVVPRHHHLRPRRQRAHPRHVRRPKIKLRPVPVEVRRVPPPLFLRQHIDLGLELLVRLDRRRLRQHLPPLHAVLFHPPPPPPHILPRPPLLPPLPP